MLINKSELFLIFFIYLFREIHEKNIGNDIEKNILPFNNFLD